MPEDNFFTSTISYGCLYFALKKKLILYLNYISVYTGSTEYSFPETKCIYYETYADNFFREGNKRRSLHIITASSASKFVNMYSRLIILLWYSSLIKTKLLSVPSFNVMSCLT